MAVIRSSISSQETAQALSKHMSDWLQGMNTQDLFRTCVTCLHLKEDKYCEVFKANPPASVIITGCDSYEDHEMIPF